MALPATQGYIHIYIGTFDQTIRFGDQPEPSVLGEPLIDFIYADLSLIRGRAHLTAESFLPVHPYFSYCDKRWQETLINALTSNDDSHTVDTLSIDQLADIQDRYRDLLSSLYNASNMLDEKQFASQLATSEWIGKMNCFNNVRLVPGSQGEACIDYFVSDFESALFLELTEVLRRRIRLKACKNCGRLFLPRRSNMDYCPRIYTKDGKSCADVGYSQTFAKNVKNDDLLQAYTRAYKAHYARMTKPRKKAANMTREAFEAWQHEARSRLDEARAGRLDADEFKNWLKL